MRKKYFLPKEMRERQGTQEIHRTERSITGWSRCFQNSPLRHYISNTERERRKPGARGWQLRLLPHQGTGPTRDLRLNTPWQCHPGDPSLGLPRPLITSVPKQPKLWAVRANGNHRPGAEPEVRPKDKNPPSQKKEPSQNHRDRNQKQICFACGMWFCVCTFYTWHHWFPSHVQSLPGSLTAIQTRAPRCQ